MEEFLWATNNEKLSIEIRKSYVEMKLLPLLHEAAMNAFREYLLVVGGMPAVVCEYSQSQKLLMRKCSIHDCQHIYC
jgi:hypothetical protein